jgi:hypothetical protein
MKAETNPRLCYLEASRVASPAGDLAGFKVETPAEESIGTLSGVLIDPSEARIRYFVVDTRRWLRGQQTYLIPTECPVSVEPERNILRVDVERRDLARLDDCDDFTIEPMSDEDMVDAMFSPHRHVAA